MNADSNIERWLKMLAPMNPYLKWILEKGELFLPVSESKNYKGYHNILKLTRPNKCFINSMAAHDIYGLNYVEGFYYFSKEAMIPLMHAWNIDSNNTLFDFTCKKHKWQPAEWFGVRVPKEIMDASRESKLPPLTHWYMLQDGSCSSHIVHAIGMLEWANEIRNEAVEKAIINSPPLPVSEFRND